MQPEVDNSDSTGPLKGEDTDDSYVMQLNPKRKSKKKVTQVFKFSSNVSKVCVNPYAVFGPKHFNFFFFRRSQSSTPTMKKTHLKVQVKIQ